MKPISEVKLLDCMEGMRQYPDKYFELAIVDPPYGLGGRVTEGGSTNSQGKKNGIRFQINLIGWNCFGFQKAR